MITKGTELKSFITSLNAEATIDETLLGVLVSTAKTIIEGERPWMVLRKTNSSLTASTSDTWQTAKNLTSTITDFSLFYSDEPIILFDSSSNRKQYYRLVPFDRRLEYKDDSGTATFDESTGSLYLHGAIPFSGTLYISYVSTSTEIDLSSESPVWSVFPSRFLPVLGFYAVGIYKGAVDYDSINRQMLPENRAALQALKSTMEKWDNERQLSSLEHNDPTETHSHPRAGAVNRYDS